MSRLFLPRLDFLYADSHFGNSSRRRTYKECKDWLIPDRMRNRWTGVEIVLFASVSKSLKGILVNLWYSKTTKIGKRERERYATSHINTVTRKERVLFQFFFSLSLLVVVYVRTARRALVCHDSIFFIYMSTHFYFAQGGKY